MAFTTTERKRKTRVLLERQTAETIDTAIGELSAEDLVDLDLYLAAADSLRFRQVGVAAGGVTVQQREDRASLQRQVRALLGLSSTALGVMLVDDD